MHDTRVTGVLDEEPAVGEARDDNTIGGRKQTIATGRFDSFSEGTQAVRVVRLDDSPAAFRGVQREDAPGGGLDDERTMADPCGDELA
jgi:hypothetical protein